MKRPALLFNRSALLRTAHTILAVIGIISCLYSASPAAMAVASPNLVHSYLNDTSAYDPDACAPGTSSGGGAATATGPAADLLKKQKGLDPRWVDLIIKDAGDSGADPLAMASLLFWENRSFPAYKTSWSVDGARGTGAWQVTSGSWPSGAGDYTTGAQDPVIETKVAADMVKSYGGVAGISLGTIQQNFSKSVALKTVATLAKNYNAGQGSYRDPGVAAWRQANRTWYDGSSPWYSGKGQIIDDYVVGMTYIYYQIANGTPVTYKDDTSFLADALTHQSAMANFKWSPDANGGSPATNNTSTGTKPTIVLDPGHAPTTDIKVDPASNIAVLDYENDPEMQQVWDVAQKVKTALDSAGYNVLLTKTAVNDSTTDLKKRADFAAQNNAALGVSIHTTPTKGGINAVYVPKVGEYRETSDGKTKKYYTNQTLADTDLKDAQTMAAARSAALNNETVKAGPYGDLIGIRDTSTSTIVSRGNVLITDYFATTPWVYNEQLQDDASGNAISAGVETGYVAGLVKGIEAIVPAGSGVATSTGTCDSTGASTAGNGATQGDIVKTALGYAWDTTGHGMNQSDAKPSYQAAMPKYNGSTGFNPYSDCGVFVATVMVASGVDPNYPKRGTTVQEPYLQNHPNLYTQVHATSTSGLQPGDIFIVNGNGQGHTYIYTGDYKGGDGKTYNAAAASLNGHVPEADGTYFSQGGVSFTIWRHK
ncbi:MAG: N-acetylmuramoyl-L-alanine amidase family protein [Candidatus Saccharibacteria bacterium]